MRVTDTDTECPSQRGSDPGVILKCHEAEKKRKYLAHCEHRHKHFTHLVFFVDGMMGVECNAAKKRLTSRLPVATKWKWMYSKVCGFVCSRLAIALVCKLVLALRPKFLNPTIPDPDAMGCGFRALTV
eukprot:scaffold79797_cov36-Attheya_sp.AAC.1